MQYSGIDKQTWYQLERHNGIHRSVGHAPTLVHTYLGLTASLIAFEAFETQLA